MPIFHPVFYIAAVAADIAYNGDFSEQSHGRGVDIIAAGMAVGIVRHTHYIS